MGSEPQVRSAADALGGQLPDVAAGAAADRAGAPAGRGDLGGEGGRTLQQPGDERAGAQRQHRAARPHAQQGGGPPPRRAPHRKGEGEMPSINTADLFGSASATTCFIAILRHSLGSKLP